MTSEAVDREVARDELEDDVEVITIQVEELEEIDETAGLGIVSGAIGNSAVFAAVEMPMVTNRFAVPPMPVPEPARIPSARTPRRMRWTPEHGVTSQPDVQVGVMTRGHK